MNWLDKVKLLWNKFCCLSVSFMLALLLVRVFEMLLLKQYGIENGHIFAFNMAGLFYDIVLYLKYSPVLFILYALTGWRFEKTAALIVKVIHVILIVISVGLIIYFCSAGMPLDKVIFYYSEEELLYIIGASETTYVWAYLCLAIIPLCYVIISKFVRKLPEILSFICVLPLIFSYFIVTPSAEDYSNRREFFIKKNKLEYFFDSFEKKPTTSIFDDIVKEEDVLYELYPDFEFVDRKYPFLHKDNANDVLSPYFDFGNKLPNIVVVIVEGLCRENSGNNSTFVSATPFLDSLSKHALCWDNCFSTSPRTAAVLPSLLGSLPYGKSGFMSYGKNVPEFNSLPKILKNNGYRFAYFYGGWLGFDDTGQFLYNNDIDLLLDKDLHKTHKRRNTWGLYDDAMIDEAMKLIGDSTRPRLDVFMTLSTHDPWVYPDKDYYQKKYESLDTTERSFNKRNIVGGASYMYADQCIRKLINEYSKRKDFENTIFVITGDHNFAEADYLHQYKVPFVIWSPMLKRNATFEPIVSHRDFTPSVLAMLKNKFDIETPEEVTWLSRGFDTIREYRSVTVVPHITYSRTISGMLSGDYLIQDKNVFKLVYENNDVEKVKDEGADSLKKYLNAYKILDRYVFENDALIRNDYDLSDMMVICDSIAENTLPLVSFANRDSVMECGRAEYPLTMMEIPLSSKYRYMKLHLSFDIYMNRDKQKPNSSVKVQIMFKKKNGKEVQMGVEHVDLYRVWAYDKWYEWTIDEIIKQKNYAYDDGDTMIVRFWNYDKLPFYLSNIRTSLSVSK